MTICNSKGV